MRGWRHRFALRTCTLTALLALCAASAAPSAHAAGPLGIAAVSSGSANPPAFVPDWNGHTDSSVIEYRVVARSLVDVVLIDSRGVTRARLDHGIRDAGTHQTWWDGRDSAGNVLPPGTYRVRVAAKPLAPATAMPVTTSSVSPASDPTQPGSAGAGAIATVAGTTDVAIALESPGVALRAVRLSRGSIGRSARTSVTRASFDLTTAASVSAAIVDSSGHVQRTLHASALPAGHQTLTWNGLNAAGKPLADGSYALLVAASGGARPTQTLRVPLRVDRTAPALTASKRVRAAATSRAVSIPVVVKLGEASALRFAVGRKTISVDKPAGTHTIKLQAGALGIVPHARASVYRIALTATDATGNARRNVIVAVVPAVRAPKPVVTPPRIPTTGNPPPQGPPAASGMRWPVDGVITAPFGEVRPGHIHSGIDIGAPNGSTIIPAAAGTVSYVGPMSGYGNLVILDHPNGVQTYYAHMSRFGRYVVGDRVIGLNEIGYVGCTGNCSGPHLHFEVRVNQKAQNPRVYLPAR